MTDQEKALFSKLWTEYQESIRPRTHEEMKALIERMFAEGPVPVGVCTKDVLLYYEDANRDAENGSLNTDWLAGKNGRAVIAGTVAVFASLKNKPAEEYLTASRILAKNDSIRAAQSIGKGQEKVDSLMASYDKIAGVSQSTCNVAIPKASSR